MNKKDSRNIRNILSSISTDPRYSGKLDEKRIERIWRETNSPFIVERTKKITFIDGKLIIHIDSAPLKQELFNSRIQIRDKINKELPGNPVEEIIIR